MSGDGKFSANTDRLGKASIAWRYSVADELQMAANHIDSLKYSTIQFGLFAGAWASYSRAAVFIQTRLTEGKNEAFAIGSALRQVAVEFGAQDEDTAKRIEISSGGMDVPQR